MKKKIITVFLLMCLIFGVSGCSLFNKDDDNDTNNDSSGNKSSAFKTPILKSSDVFTDKDNETVNTSNSSEYELVSDENITIDSSGVYVIVGNASNSSIVVDAKDGVVDLVLDNITIGNYNSPCINIKNAKSVQITLVGTNKLNVSGNSDSVINANSNLTIKGKGTLEIDATNNGIYSSNDLRIMSGTINIKSTGIGMQAINSIGIADGTIKIDSTKDGMQAKNDNNDQVGYVYISGGTINITSEDDAIHGTTELQIDGGILNLNAHECLESNYVQINDGTINLTAADDGINATTKSTKYTPTIEINGGVVNIEMAEGDTDAIDSNGNLYINGGTLNINANSPFDYDGTGELNGGNVTVNGEVVTELTNQFMGGPGGPDGGMPPNR